MNITLIGMSGVGKSLVGKELAKNIKCNFIDIDELIERKYNLELQKLVEKLGKKKFLKLEERAVLEIGKTDNSVISTGGSVVYSEKAMRFLKTISKIVFLDAPLNDIKNRIPDFSKRGIVGLENGLEKLFDERRQLYKKYADITIKVPRKFDLNIIIKNIIKNL
ncbi:MAG: shikimate kinase [Candidatus Bathyarchaeota archaeon]|nr:shikimate kinase [Candidatus Bathyarchaeota archaeon]